MPLIADILSWLIVAALALMSLAFLVETSLGLLPPTRASRAPQSDVPPETVIVVPAYNEEQILSNTLAALSRELPLKTRILVVADNCADATARVAREAGVDAIERQDVERRGKGYALGFARDHLRASPPEAVIVFDADCTTDRHSLMRLADVAVRQQRAAQASYLLEPRLEAAPAVQISSFAFLVKNFVRQLGASRLDGAAILTGTGMAFPWTIFNEVELAGGSVEDLDLTVELVGRGLSPVFVAEARVWSAPAAAGASAMQRDRWERGFVSTAARAVPRLTRLFLRTGRPGMAWLALHLLTPPLALLVLLSGVGTMILLLLHLLAAMSTAPLVAAAALLLAIAILVLAAWVRFGRSYVSAGAIIRIPLYIAWKLPIYLRLLTGAERGWNRTER